MHNVDFQIERLKSCNHLANPLLLVDVDPKAIPSICAWSDFPTMPQVFVHGELIGGSDIALEMLQDGSLKEMFDAGRE